MRQPRKLTFPIFFLGLFAAMTLPLGSLGLISDGVYRAFGHETRAITVSEVGEGKYRRAVISYTISGKSYTKTSLRGPGFYEMGDAEIVRYFPSSPLSAKEDFNSRFDLVWLVGGIVCAALAAALYLLPQPASD